MSSFLQTLSNKNLTFLDERLLVSLDAPKTILSKSNRLFEIGTKEIDKEIKESTEKELKKARVYKVARIIINVIGISLVCIFPIAIIFNIPFWVPLVVSLIGGLTLSFISGKLRSKEQLIRLRHKSLLFYRQRLLNKELNVQRPWKDRAAKNKANEDKVDSKRMELIYKEVGIDSPMKSRDSILSDRISSLNLETPIFLHRYESGTISGDAQTLLKSWRMYQKEVLKLKNNPSEKESKLESSLLQLRNQAYASSGMNLVQLPIQGAEDGLREIKSFCSYGLQIADILQKSLSQYQMNFPLLSLIANSELDLGVKVEEKLEEISILSRQIKYCLKKLSLVKTEEEALSVMEEVTSIDLITRIRSMINSSSSLNSSILSKISHHPTNLLLSYKQRLANLKIELKDPLWASEWFEVSECRSWKDQLLKFCSFSKEANCTRDDVRKNLLLQISEKEEILLSIEKKWGAFLDNDFAKLSLEDSLEKFNDFNKTLRDPLDKNISESLLNKMNSLKSLFLEEMIGADNESAAEKIMEISKELEIFNAKHLKKLEVLVSNHGRSFLDVIASSLTTKNSTFRRRQKEAAKKYRESVSVSGSLSEISFGLRTSSKNQMRSFKSLLYQFEQVEAIFSESVVEGNETKLLQATQKIKETCQDFSVDELNLLKNYLSTFSKKLKLVSKHKEEKGIDYQLIDETQLELEIQALEKQAQSEKNEIKNVRDRCRFRLHQILNNIEKQVVSIYMTQLISNMVLSLVFFLLVSLLGAFLISFNVWWVHLIFLGVTLSFIGINFIFSYLIDRKAKKKIDVDLQKNFLISSEIKESAYPNSDLARLKELQGILGLDGIHDTWAKKEILNENENTSNKLITEKSKEEVLKDLKIWHKELNKKNIPSFEFTPQTKQNISDSKELEELKEIVAKNNFLEKSIISKEFVLDKILSEQLLQEQELIILEKEYKKFQALSLEIEKEKADIVRNEELATRLQIKHHFLKNILDIKSKDIKKEQLNKARLLFDDLLNIYKDESLSNQEKKDKSKSIIKLIYKEDLFSLVHDLINSELIKGNEELNLLSDQDTKLSFQKEGLFWNSDLKKTVGTKIKYLRDLIQSLEIIENDKNLTSTSFEMAEKALFLVEKFPIFLKEAELIPTFIPCAKLEEARVISLEVEKEKKEFLQKRINQESLAINNLNSVFSSLLKKLLLRDSTQLEEASLKLEKLISLVVNKSSENIDKEEKILIGIFQKFPLHFLKNMEKEVLLQLAKIHIQMSIYQSKVEKLSYIKECLNKDNKRSLSLEEYRKILMQKKEKAILKSKKLVKEKVQEIQELKQKKLVDGKRFLEISDILKKERGEEESSKSIKIESPKTISIIDKKTKKQPLQGSYDFLLGKMILSRKEVAKFSSLYKKWKDKDPVHANHMRKMHRRAKEEYNNCYEQLIAGICSDSLSIPERLDAPFIKSISEKIKEKQNLFIDIENRINNLNLKEEELLLLQQKIGKKQQELSIIEEKVDELQSLHKLQDEILSLRKEEDILLEEVKELVSLKELQQSCLKDLTYLKEQFFNAQ